MAAALITAGVIFFSLAHPGILNSRGVSFFGFIYLVPVFILIHKYSLKKIIFFGFIFGLFSYGVFAFWLFKYNFFAYFIACFYYGILISFVFVLMKLINCFFYKNNYINKMIIRNFYSISVSIIWCLYEYFKTKGFLGLNYGITGYTQWKNKYFLRLSSLGGIWIVSLLCVLTSCFVAQTLIILQEKENIKNRFFTVIKNNILILIILFIIPIVSIVMGPSNKNKSINTKDIKIICVQPNTDPWKNDLNSYSKDVELLKELTDIELSTHPNADIVVWPESAVVPSIMWNYYQKTDEERLNIINNLLKYIESKNCIFVLGNQQTEKINDLTYDYNSVLVFNPIHKNVIPPNPEIYKKTHLVPFTEYFPYDKIFPRINNFLLDGDTHLWTPGNDYVIFNENNIKFFIPICFEDTFGSLCRKFINNKNKIHKVDFIINISNDSWSHSKACQNQHLAMAVFRSAENEIPSVRGTASGMTCQIDEYGVIQKQIEPFRTDSLYCNLKINKNNQITFYTKYGDWIIYVEVIILFLLILVTTLFTQLQKKRIINKQLKNNIKMM